MYRLETVISLACIFMAASCVNEKVEMNHPSDDFSNERKDVITFGASMPATKSYSVNEKKTVDDLKTTGMLVAAVSGGNLMFNEAANWNNERGCFMTQNTYYWPGNASDNILDFYACSPTSKTEVSLKYANSKATLSYNSSYSVDLLAAKCSLSKPSNSSVVNLQFDHILAQIGMKVSGLVPSVKYKVKKVVFETPKTGTYSFDDGSWTRNAQILYLDFYNASSNFVETTSTSEGVIEGHVALIPGETKVTIDYDVYDANGLVLLSSFKKQALIDLVMGKNTTVTAYLPFDNATEMSFAVTIKNWETATDTIEENDWSDAQ